MDAAMKAFEDFKWEVALTPRESAKMLQHSKDAGPGPKALGYLPDGAMADVEKASEALMGFLLSCMDGVVQNQNVVH